MGDIKILPLTQGDMVELIAPASGFSKEVYDKSIQYVESIGLVVSAPQYEEIIDNNYYFTANNKNKRSELFEKAINSNAKAIWCISGGYGSYELIDLINSMKEPLNPKLLIGFSDITILLNTVLKKWNWNSLHSPMLKQIIEKYHTNESVEKLENTLFGRINSLEYPLENISKVDDKEILGKVIGGCASLIQTLIGTKDVPDLSGSIVFLEDDEYETPARLHRLFNQIIRSDILEYSKAVVLGSLYKNKDENNDIIEQAIAELKNYLMNKNIPLFRCKTIGHTENASTIIMGAEGKIFNNTLYQKINV